MKQNITIIIPMADPLMVVTEAVTGTVCAPVATRSIVTTPSSSDTATLGSDSDTDTPVRV